MLNNNDQENARQRLRNSNNTTQRKSRKEKIHKNICDELHRLYERKNSDYGDSFKKTRDEYGMLPYLVRVTDKLNRLKSLCKKDRKVEDETINDTLRDLANYSVMELTERIAEDEN